MNAIDLTPDLFEGQPEAPHSGVTAGPSFDHEVQQYEEHWRKGWHCHTGAGWAFMAYAPEVFDWLRQQLTSGPKEYGALLDARREAGLEHPFDVADLIRAHVRFLVLAGEAIERKRYLGDPDPNSPRYHGWHPVIELAGGDA